jgi:hypothetical protein
VPVPAAVRQSLRDLPVSRLEGRYFGSRWMPFNRWNSLHRLWADYRFRLAPAWPLARALRGFPEYLQRRWDLDSPWELAPAIWQRVRRFPAR